jgi:hypothetical protein
MIFFPQKSMCDFSFSSLYPWACSAWWIANIPGIEIVKWSQWHCKCCCPSLHIILPHFDYFFFWYFSSYPLLVAVSVYHRFPIIEPDPNHTKLHLASEGLEAIKRITNPIAAVAVCPTCFSTPNICRWKPKFFCL